MSANHVTTNDWIRGIAFSVTASVIGGASKLSIRKSWLMSEEMARIEESMTVDRELGGVFDATVQDYETPMSSNQAISRQSTESEEGSDQSRDSAMERTNLTPLELSAFKPPESFEPSHSLQEPPPRSGDRHVYNLVVERVAPSLRNNHADTKRVKIMALALRGSGMIGMTFLNPLCCVLAMKYASPSILAPFSGLTLVWVVLFSGFLVGEHPERSQKIACGMIIAGQVLVAVFGDHTNDDSEDYESLLLSYYEPAFIAFIVMMLAWLFFLCIAILVCPKGSLMRKVAWGLIGGSLTGFQNFLKDSLSILNISKASSISLPDAFYVFAFLAMLTSFLGLLCLAACMKRFDATYSSAMFVVSFVLSASLMSSIHYNTFQNLAGIQNYIMYPVGLIILFLGALLLISPPSASDINDPQEEPASGLNTILGRGNFDFRKRLLHA